MKKYALEIVLAAFVLVGFAAWCQAKDAVIQPKQRFSVVEAASPASFDRIYIITDNKTGREFMWSARGSFIEVHPTLNQTE